MTIEELNEEKHHGEEDNIGRIHQRGAGLGCVVSDVCE
jgi:hypothetical protein